MLAAIRTASFAQPSRSFITHNSNSPTLASLTFRRMFALTPYRAEQAKTFSRQKELPRLPIPKLEASLERYLKSLKPLLLENAEKSGKGEETIHEELTKRKEIAADFANGLGKLLQERLKDVDRTAPSNWLDDVFWIKNAYHSWRVPLPINSNWWLLMHDDKNIPEQFRSSVPPKGEFTEWQIRRAAKLTQRFTQFKLNLDREEILPDSSRAGPFDMHQYTRVFGITRVPSYPYDQLIHTPHPHSSNYALICANDHFYKLPVTTTGSDSVGADLLSLDQLEAGLWAIAEDATQRGTGEGVGACSGDNRDEWTNAREHLLTIDPVNRSTITAIEDALFVIALDNQTAKSEIYKTSAAASQTPDLDAHIRAGSSAFGTGRNRWWDKAVTLNVESNARATMNGEHSPCDALIPSIVADYILAEDVEPNRAIENSFKGKSNDSVQHLPFVLDDKARASIDSAVKTIGELAADSEGKMLWYDEYGVDWIKKVGKQSPDAYCQMALQLAFHKTHNRSVATYETASTRLFLHGRTDVIRTLSEDSWRWVHAMREGNRNPKELYSLLTAATKAHNTYTRDSSTGRGCDRHFMGLRLCMREGETHPIFDDPLFGESQSWILSTSGLSAGDRFFGTGFGTVWSEGYGINYLAGGKVIKFGIESKRSDPDTSTETFRANLIEAMRDMRKICELGQVPEEQTAKL